MARAPGKLRKIGRNADNGKFTPVKTARRKRATHTVETLSVRRKRTKR